MSRAVASKAFSRQPQYPAKIDTAHQIGRKVTAAFSAHYGANVSITEMVSGVPATVATGAINGTTNGSVGKAFRPSSTSSGVYWPGSNAFCTGARPFSIEILFTYLSADSNFSRFLDMSPVGSGAPSGGWDLEADGSGGLNFGNWNGGSASVANAAAGLVAGRTYHLVITSAGAGATTAISYVNAVPSTMTGLAMSARSAAFPFFYSTYQTAGGVSAAGIATHLVRLYDNTILTPSEVKRLYEKPFEMFRRPKRVPTFNVTGGATTHPSSGALVGQGSTVVGSATHIGLHPSTGALVGQGSAVAGTATRFRAHPSTGVLTGQGAVVAGSAAHTAQAHATSGALVGQGALVVGTATRFRAHPSTGALTGQGAVIAGTANRTKFHPTSGVLTGQGSTVAGSAVHTAFVPTTHTTSGVLLGPGSLVVGYANAGPTIVQVVYPIFAPMRRSAPTSSGLISHDNVFAPMSRTAPTGGGQMSRAMVQSQGRFI